MSNDPPQTVLVAKPEADGGFSPPRFRPVATFVILAITFAFFFLEILAGGSTSPEVLLQLGAAYAPYIRHGEYWRLVMPMFLHAGWLHIILNAYALYLLGPLLERLYGYGRFAWLYVVSGIGASIVSVWRSGSIAVGASGAILGVMGAMAVIGYLHRDVVPLLWRRLFGGRMVVLILISLAFGPAVNLAGEVLKRDLPTIDNWAHL
ncbi:MAG TPA: rhomboid family intramembrane serine protease, partial [Terriglobia bacterium]|nr:rhomboid family intramembrane serine protease [Terriglobia bacterium]